MLSSIRLALRSFAKSPGFTFVAIVTLALGISMSTSSFSIANVLVFRSLPFPESNRLVSIFRTTPQSGNLNHSPGNYLDLKRNSTSFSAFSAYSFNYASYVPKGQPAQQVLGMPMTADLLGTVGMQPALGRGFAVDEDKPGKEPVVILTNRMWTRRFGSDPSIIGKPIRIDGVNHTVIGVMPARFEVLTLWGPIDFLRTQTIWPSFETLRKDKWFYIVARLKPGVSEAQAQAELNTICARMNKDYPIENSSDGLRTQDLSSAFVGSLNASISYLIIGLSCMVLLIACANLASIQIARAFNRARDYAIRSALGASRRHLMAPLFVESLLLSIAGGLLGLIIASWTTSLIGRNVLINYELGMDIPIDGRVLSFALAVSFVTALVSGLVPAWIASKTTSAEALKEGGRGTAGSLTHKRAKHFLVIGELALALVLVGVASSFGLGIKRFLQRDLGWQMKGLAAGTLSLPYDRYPDDEKRQQLCDKLMARLQVIPGVDKAVLARNLPLFAFFSTQNVIIDGQTPPVAGQEPQVQTAAVSHEFFSALQIPLRKGSLFPANIKASDPAVIVVNKSLADRFWPGQDPIGKRIRWRENQKWLEVIGVVGDIRMAASLLPPSTSFQVYRPMVHELHGYFDIILRAKGAPESLVGPMRKAVAEVDPDLPVVNPDSVASLVKGTVANLDIVVEQMGLYALMGLLISALSVYGVISHLTAQRTREFGVRIALGAEAGNIIRMTLSQGAWMLGFGVLIGVAGSFALSRVLQNMMPEVGVPGIWLQLVSAFLLGIVTIFACWLPARRASRIDPVIALRSE